VLIGASLYPDWRFQLVESLLDAYAPFTKLKERQNNTTRARKAGIMRARGLELITTPFSWTHINSSIEKVKRCQEYCTEKGGISPSHRFSSKHYIAQ
jgi:hypothetical protein